MVVRPFDWRDLVLLHRTRHLGVCLDSRLALHAAPQAVQNTLVDAFVPGNRGADDRHALSTLNPMSRQPWAAAHQRRPPAGAHRVHQPFGPLDKRAGLQLLDGLARAGERGGADARGRGRRTDPHFEALRRAGFAIFARQRLWLLAQETPIDAANLAELWRPVAARDHASIQSLYMNLVPALVQQVERPPVENPLGLMYCEDDEALGYLDVQKGPNGIWVQPYFHPAAALSDDLMAGFIQPWPPRRANRSTFASGPTRVGSVVPWSVLGSSPAPIKPSWSSAWQRASRGRCNRRYQRWMGPKPSRPLHLHHSSTIIHTQRHHRYDTTTSNR